MTNNLYVPMVKSKLSSGYRENVQNNNNRVCTKIIMKEHRKLSLSKKVISALEDDRMGGIVGGEAGQFPTFVIGCTRGCTDGCTTGPLQTWFNCTEANCTADCGSTMTCYTKREDSDIK